ncbi:MAG: hypothetical protein K2J85_04430 [Anaeroplasmataceae bacterium]|nr:hypothetical protein [Anaeroplasmataceae bacterium]
MNDITKSNFRKQFISWFLLLAFFLIPMFIILDARDYISMIPLAIMSFITLLIICFLFRAYLKYKHNMNVLEGTITNVIISHRSYQIVIKNANLNYVASYTAVFPHIFSSHMKDNVGKKCFFVINKKGKAYIRDIE